MRNLLAFTAVALLAAGCAFYPSAVDERFGASNMNARAQQTGDPAAAAKRSPAPGIDGKAAAASVQQYEKSFEAPPPPVNVFTIGVGNLPGSSGQ